MKQLLTLVLLGLLVTSCSTNTKKARLLKTGYPITVQRIPSDLKLNKGEEIVIYYDSTKDQWEFDNIPTIKFEGTDTLIIGKNYRFAYYKAEILE